MMKFFTKLIDLIPNAFVSTVLLFSSAFVYIFQNVIFKSFQTIEYLSQIKLICLLIMILFAFSCGIHLIRFLWVTFKLDIDEKDVLNALKILDNEKKSILREFKIQKKINIVLPKYNLYVKELVSDGIILESLDLNLSPKDQVNNGFFRLTINANKTIINKYIDFRKNQSVSQLLNGRKYFIPD